MLISLVCNFFFGTLGGFVGAVSGLNVHMWRDPEWMTPEHSSTAATFMCAAFALWSGVGAALLCAAFGWVVAWWPAFLIGGISGFGIYTVNVSRD